MALNIKNPQVEQLASEIAALTGESKTDVIRQILLERRQRLRQRVPGRDRRARIRRFMEREVWSRIPAAQTEHAPGREERERNLGCGPSGV
jgi:antitoxin VapB